MKQIRFLALVLVLGLILCCVGCNGGDSNTSSNVTYFDGDETVELTAEAIGEKVEAGTIDIEFEGAPSETDTEVHAHGDTIKATVNLGMDSSSLAELLAPSGYVSDVHRKVGENYIRHECGNSLTAYFYYTNDDRKNGLASVVYFGTAYGFEPTVTTIDQVKQVMGSPLTEGPADEKALSMFLFYEPGYSYIDYKCGNNHVSFFFHENGTLGATEIYQDGLWIY